MSRTYSALKRAEAERATPPRPRGIDVERSEPAVHRIPLNDGIPCPEEYAKIRAWLTTRRATSERVQAVMVVACRAGAGNTTTAALLAATLSEGRHSRVLLVEADVRTPTLAAVFGVEGSGGFGEVVVERLPVETRVRATRRPHLQLLTSGYGTACAADVFEPGSLATFVTEAKRKFDFIVLDAAPVLEFSDALALAPAVDVILLTVDADRTSIDDAERAKRMLEDAGGRLFGVVLNREKDYVPAFVKRWLRLGG